MRRLASPDRAEGYRGAAGGTRSRRVLGKVSEAGAQRTGDPPATAGTLYFLLFF